MRKTVKLLAMITVLLALAAGSSANAEPKLRVNIPFAFYVDKQLLPAAEYTFEMRPSITFVPSSTLMVVRKGDGTFVAWVATLFGTETRGNVEQLLFHRYDDKYFLSRVEALNCQLTLTPSRIEKEFRAQGVKKQNTTLLAGR